MLHLCLIEDNEKLGDMVQQELIEAGYLCDRHTNAEKVDEKKMEKYHVFIVDIMLPWEDGISFAANIRKKSSAWIIFVTAKWAYTVKEEAFSVWADDYITKPFKVSELLLRIKALAERLEPTHYFKLRDVLIDRKSRIAKKWWTIVHLTPIERQVVWCLLRNRWTVCWRADLIEYVWWTDEMFGMNRSLDVAVANIRKKLWKEFIETLPGIWYQLWVVR